MLIGVGKKWEEKEANNLCCSLEVHLEALSKANAE